MNSENECNPLLFNDEESENSFLIKEDLKIDDNIDKKAEIATENSLKEEKNGENNKMDDNVNKNDENNKIDENIDKKVEIGTENSLKEDINPEKIVMNVIEEKNNLRWSEIICIILIGSIMILLELVFHFILSIIFIYYKKSHKQCKAKLYTKINLILYIYLAMLIIYILTIILTIIFVFKGKSPNKFTPFYLIIGLSSFALDLSSFALELTNLIIVHSNYNKSKKWDHCGKFKSWTIFWLVMNYLSIIGGVLGNICKNRKKN